MFIENKNNKNKKFLLNQFILIKIEQKTINYLCVIYKEIISDLIFIFLLIIIKNYYN
jgi:hypothetical protein